VITCTVLDSQLESYLAGRLGAAEAEALEAHAGGCERCAELLEQRSRLTIQLPREVQPAPATREAVLAAIGARGKVARRNRWFVPAAIAAGLLLAFSVMMPTTKSGQRRTFAGSPAALAAERADGEFQQLDAARAELRAALVAAPDDPMLRRTLDRLDAQRRSLENLIREFET
jgi:anti-sigma factor RsiW